MHRPISKLFPFKYNSYLCETMKVYGAIRTGLTAIRILVAVAIAVAVAIGAPCILSKMQIIPAIVTCATLWIGVWGAVTLIFGRIYCSTICPTGALIDIVSKIAKSKKGSHFTYSLPLTRFRISMVIIIAVCVFFGLSAILSVFDPYSAFTRIVSACAKPIAIGAAGLTLAIITLAVILFFSWRRGRLLCNTICPVGTLLGFASKYSVYHADINTDLCINCGKCADKCPSECINLTDHVIDHSRCVVCFDCMPVCPNDAITYRRGRHQLTMPMMQPLVSNAGVSPVEAPDAQVRPIDRRTFLITGLIAATAAATETIDKTSSIIVPGAKKLLPLNYVTPPGVASREDYLKRCTACGSCIAACPSGVLTSSVKEFGFRHAIVPVMNFDRSFCRYDCVKCTEVCPTKALNQLTVSEKHNNVIGKARIEAGNCMLFVDGTPCGICERRCPKRAITINSDTSGRRVPQVDFDLCIGCGQCSYACPSKPYRAIVIEGI